MRVLVLGWDSPPLVSGGVGTASERLTRALIETGVDILMIRPRSDQPEPAEPEHVPLAESMEMDAEADADFAAEAVIAPDDDAEDESITIDSAGNVSTADEAVVQAETPPSTGASAVTSDSGSPAVEEEAGHPEVSADTAIKAESGSSAAPRGGAAEHPPVPEASVNPESKLPPQGAEPSKSTPAESGPAPDAAAHANRPAVIEVDSAPPRDDEASETPVLRRSAAARKPYQMPPGKRPERVDLRAGEPEALSYELVEVDTYLRPYLRPEHPKRVMILPEADPHAAGVAPGEPPRPVHAAQHDKSSGDGKAGPLPETPAPERFAAGPHARPQAYRGPATSPPPAPHYSSPRPASPPMSPGGGSSGEAPLHPAAGPGAPAFAAIPSPPPPPTAHVLPPPPPPPGDMVQEERDGASRRRYSRPSPAWAHAQESQRHFGEDIFTEVDRYAHLATQAAMGQKFDVIHAHDWMTVPAAMAISDMTGVPYVLHVHSTEHDRAGRNCDERIREIERVGMERAAAVIAVSHLTKEVIGRYGVSPDKVHVVYNAVDLPDKKEPAASPIRKGERIVLFLGRITMQKGPEYFLAAARKVLQVYKNVRFVVAGSGDMVQPTIELAAELGIGRKVLFTGFLEDEDVERVFRSADLYVMPSVSDPFGLASLEAIRYGVPVLVSRQSGVAEVMENVLKVDFWDIDRMANKIVAVLRHPPLRTMLREQAGFEVKRLTWRRAAEECVGVYRGVTGTLAPA